MMRLKTVIALTVTIATAAACGKSDASHATGPVPLEYCSAVAPVALAITVRDSISGQALADSASGSFRVDALSDTLIHVDSLQLYGGRQTGTYDVTVQRSGYKTWTRLGVVSTKTSACGGVEPVQLTAAMQRLP
jgi:hypothetical protein